MTDLVAVLRSPSVVRLLVFSLLGRLPTAIAALAITALVRGHGGSFAAAGAATGTYALGYAFSQPALARVIDRRGQSGVLLWSGLLSSAGFAALALTGRHAALLWIVLAAVTGLTTPPLEPALRALWPRLVSGGARLRSAYSLDAGAQELIFVVGPVIAAVALVLAGSRGGAVAAAACGVLGCVPFALTRACRDVEPHPRPSSGKVATFSRPLVRVLVLLVGSGLPVGALAILAVGIAEDHGTRALAGWAVGANALGALASGVYAAVRPDERPADVASVRRAAAWLAVGYLPLALPLPLPLWFGCCLLAGLMLPRALMVTFALAQRVTPAAALTEANGWVTTAFGSGVAAAAAIAGLLQSAFSTSAATAVTIGLTSGAALALCLVDRLLGPDPGGDEQPAGTTLMMTEGTEA